MSDVRARLADALREHSHDFDPNGHINGTVPGRGTHDCWCGDVFAKRDEQAGHLADVLLSLPGIAIVELPESADGSGDWPCIGIGTGVWINPLTGFARFQTNQFDPGLARSVAAALLAAANAADAVTR